MRIRRRIPHARPAPHGNRCARSGAQVVNHDARLLLATTALDDELGLTPRERQMIDRIATGETNGQVARALGIAEATVRKHLEHAFQKPEVSTRTGRRSPRR